MFHVEQTHARLFEETSSNWGPNPPDPLGRCAPKDLRGGVSAKGV